MKNNIAEAQSFADFMLKNRISRILVSEDGRVEMEMHSQAFVEDAIRKHEAEETKRHATASKKSKEEAFLDPTFNDEPNADAEYAKAFAGAR